MSGKVNQAFEGLRKMISSGELGPGDRLPSEVELCSHLDVSRSSLREAQKMLTVVGVLTSRTGSGTYVSQLTAEDFMSGLGITVPLLPLDPFLSLYDMRCVLEGHAAGQAAARFTPEQRQELSELAERIAAQEWGAEAESLDDRFHELLVEGADNPPISAMLAIIRSRGRHYRVFEVDAQQVMKRESDEAHRRIAEAVMNRDPEVARVEAMAHVMTTRRWLVGIKPPPDPKGPLLS